jgi:hypothetical protein
MTGRSDGSVTSNISNGFLEGLARVVAEDGEDDALK